MSISLQDIAWLKAHFGDECKELCVEGDEPLVLDDPSYGYVTQVPHHQLFCVGYRERAAFGRREHVAMCEAGQLLFGCGLGPGEQAALLLSGAAGSHVVCIPAKRLFGALTEAKPNPLIERLFEGWVALLVSMLPGAPVPTRCDPLGPGTTLESLAAPVRAREGVVWIELSQPPSRYGGVNIVEDDRKLVRWPLTESAWLVGESEQARTFRGVELVARAGAGVIEEFYAFVVARLARSS